MQTPALLFKITPALIAPNVGRTQNPRELGCLLGENNAHVVGVHIFYPQTESARSFLQKRKDYSDYYQNTRQMLSSFSPEMFQRTVLLVESERGMLRTSELLNEVSPHSHFVKYFLSSLGWILDCPAHDSPKNFESMGRIFSAVNSGFVFTFGMFEQFCLGRAKGDLRAMAQNSGVYSFEIGANAMVSLKE